MFKKLISKKHKPGFASFLFYLLLIYIVAALVWWFISLMQQSNQMTNYKLLEQKADDPAYLNKIEEIEKEKRRTSAKYIGEGVVFFSLILVGAFFVHRAMRKEIKFAKQQHNFMMAVTHELKTPIAIAKLNLETIQKHKLPEEKQQKITTMTLQEINRLDTLASNILVSAQMEESAFRSTKEEIDFSGLAQKCAESFRTRFPVKEWFIDIAKDISIAGDPLLLQILINNLLDNAVKYTNREGKIYFSLYHKKNIVALNVADNGIGIADNEKPKIFDRFYRIGDEAVRSTKGTGLGLYLCKKIAVAHNAKILVTDNVPTGTNFSIQFHI